MVIPAYKELTAVILGNCQYFKTYVTNALGRLTKKETIRLLPDNLKALANPTPTANNNNKSPIVLKPG